MSLEITIHPIANSSPAQAGKPTLPDIVNDDFFGSFADILDVINPLQHIPVIGSLYRELSGDTLSPGARIAGGALFGGAFGLFASIANAVIEEESGKDIGANLFAAVTDRYNKTNALA